MENIFNIKFTFEQNAKDKVITSFSTKQGGDFNVFSYHWQCFAWAAIIGFIHDRRRPVGSPKADQVFSLNTMMNNGGERIAEALICMCIAKYKSLDIMKDPHAAVEFINEYANGGFDYIMEKLRTEGMTNDFEWVKQEVFSRGEDDTALSHLQKDISQDAYEPIEGFAEQGQNAASQEVAEYDKPQGQPKGRSRWTTHQIGELKLYRRQGMDVELLASFFHKSVSDVESKIKELGL